MTTICKVFSVLLNSLFNNQFLSVETISRHFFARGLSVVCRNRTELSFTVCALITRIYDYRLRHQANISEVRSWAEKFTFNQILQVQKVVEGVSVQYRWTFVIVYGLFYRIC